MEEPEIPPEAIVGEFLKEEIAAWRDEINEKRPKKIGVEEFMERVEFLPFLTNPKGETLFFRSELRDFVEMFTKWRRKEQVNVVLILDAICISGEKGAPKERLDQVFNDKLVDSLIKKNLISIKKGTGGSVCILAEGNPIRGLVLSKRGSWNKVKKLLGLPTRETVLEKRKRKKWGLKQAEILHRKSMRPLPRQPLKPHA
jgi:hypothetical protein